MAIIQNINVSSPNDGLGDPLRTSQVKANENFAELNLKKVEVQIGRDLSDVNFSQDDKDKLDSLENSAGNLNLIGKYNATINVPVLANATGNIKDVYEVTVGGTQDYGDGFEVVVEAGDFIYKNFDGKYRKFIDNNQLETLTTIGTLTNSATEKTTLLDADTIVGNDSVTPFGLIKITLLNVWNYLKVKVEALISEQIIISTSTATADSTWHNRTIVFTANCVVTIAGTLPANFVFNGIKLTGVFVTFGITTPKVWLDTAPTTISGARSTFNIIQQGSTNNIIFNG